MPRKHRRGGGGGGRERDHPPGFAWKPYVGLIWPPYVIRAVVHMHEVDAPSIRRGTSPWLWRRTDGLADVPEVVGPRVEMDRAPGGPEEEAAEGRGEDDGRHRDPEGGDPATGPPGHRRRAGMPGPRGRRLRQLEAHGLPPVDLRERPLAG